MTANAPPEVKALYTPAGYGNLPEGWSWACLEDLCEGIYDCPHSTPKLTAKGPYVARTQDISSGIFRAEQAAHVSAETYLERTKRATPSPGDLLYSREGTYFGIAAEVPKNTQVCLGQRMVLIRPDSEKVNFRFLRHWLNSPLMVAYIRGFRDGSVAERLNLPTIRSLPILVFPTFEQGAIADALGALDDKIAVNGRIAATALELARCIYGGFAAGAYTCSELGKLVTFKYGKALRAPDRREGAAPVYGCTGQVGWHDTSLTLGPTAVVGRKGANAGWVSWSPQPCWVIDTAFFVEARVESLSSEIIFLMLETANLPGFVGDSAVPGLNREVAHRILIKVPEPEAAAEVSERVRPLMARATQAEQESSTLAALRDTLLPQLMSGKLRVRDAEWIVEDAL
jgi:type I restriction enzyme S subunit